MEELARSLERQPLIRRLYSPNCFYPNTRSPPPSTVSRPRRRYQRSSPYAERWRLAELDALRSHDSRFDPGLERDQHGTPEVKNCGGGQ